MDALNPFRAHLVPDTLDPGDLGQRVVKKNLRLAS
jgi:hypothetical protein